MYKALAKAGVDPPCRCNGVLDDGETNGHLLTNRDFFYSNAKRSDFRVVVRSTCCGYHCIA